MDDDDVEVIEELNTKRASDNSPSNSWEAKKPRVDGGFGAAKYNGDVCKSILIHLNLVKDLPNLILPETEKIFHKQCSEAKMAVDRMDTSLKKIVSSRMKIENFLAKASYLISIPVNPSCASMPNFFRPPNGLHPLNTYSQSSIHTTSQQVPRDTCNTDGLQIVRCVTSCERNLPPSLPFGQLPRRIDPVLNSKVYAMKTDLFGVWFKSVIVSIREGHEKTYRVKFEGNHKSCFKICNAKQIAHENPAEYRLPFGKRIIAFYKPEDKSSKPVMYAGIIAEPPKSTNRYRYLVFFDDGFAQYIEHNDIRPVYEESKNVWEDIHPDTREFIKSYCEQFPERPMLKLQKNQVVKTEYNSGWWLAKVIDVDASMVKMYFEAEKRYEWIYRGSTRLAPLFNELEKAKHNRLSGKVRRHNITTRKMKENQPYVEYTRTFDEIVLDSDDSDAESKKASTPEKPVRRNVAKKSTTQTKKIISNVAAADSDVRNTEGELYFVSLPTRARLKYIKHICGSLCKEKGDPALFRGKNPLRIPMYLGWERHFKKFRQRGYSSVIHYRAPCGKMLRNIGEVNFFLFLVESKLTIDMFTFDPQLCPFQSFRTSKEETLWSTDDITCGKENVPIECVNCLTNEKPVHVEYATERFPGKGVTLNLDKEFLCGCDCTDNCQDPLKCQCRQLTIKAYSKDGSVTDVGYNYRRLTEPIVTGIYECNSRCKCGSSCMNRVVQNGLQIRLQMFKTAKKGWGIRCLDDVDAGMFLCIYAGQLLTEQGADEDGHQFGDEYLAELDHIEVAEKMKEGYESDVPADIEDVKTKVEEPVVKEISESDDESDISSYKSNSSSQNSNSQDSDPEYEGRIRRSTGPSSYATRSKNKVKPKKKFSLFPPSEFSIDSEDDSSTYAASETSSTYNLGQKQEELPDLDAPTISQKLILPRPLSPTTAEQIESVEINRKPRICNDNAEFEKSRSKLSGVTKKSQSLSKQPLPPPVPVDEKPNKYLSVRTYFNEDYCYIMDAKSKGNIGRYLNHSCFPNSFVQNVFVDTHDLRFPTVAFFASDRIKAGTELTWDYNYEVGSVQNKVLYCHCESKNCRGRLL